MVDPRTPIPAARRYLDFARREVGDRSPIMRDWAAGIAADPDLLALIETLPAVKQQPNLVIAAARWHGARPGPYASLRQVLLDRWEEIARTVTDRSTQTNEVGRCATLLPLLAALPGPLALIDVGASAGLCLFPERYSYRYTRAGQVVWALDPPSGVSPVVLPCEVASSFPLPTSMPRIAWRRGIDLDPVDVTDPGQVRWLETLVWPGQEARLDRLRAAVALVAPDPPILLRGDALDLLPETIAQAPAGATVVVMHSAVLAYLAPESRERFAAMMRALVEQGVCRWVSNEGPKVLPPSQGAAPASPDPEQALFLTMLDGRPVAWSGPHGQSLAWR